MNILQQKSLHQLTGFSNLQEVSVDEMFKLAEEHPYFSVSHFFLSKKLEEEKNNKFLPQLQKTALYFTNPHWLHYQLLHKVENLSLVPKKSSAIDMETEPLLKKVVEEEIQSFTKTEDSSANMATIEPIIVEKIEDTISDTSFGTSIEIPSYQKVSEIVNSIETPKPMEEIAEELVHEEAVENVQIQQPSITSFALEATENDNSISTNSIQSSAEEVITTPTENEIEQDDLETLEEDIEEKVLSNAVSEEKLALILKEQLEEFKKPVEESTEIEIESEPFHTVDYFASQGIHTSFEQLGQDKLSNQLRKFTDWLKQMKHNPVSENDDLGTDPELETAIHGIAKTSNEAKEIVTETMAEVLEKQGKTDKAIQLYIKLSFLNPDKSTYFASKIQKLKGII